MNQVTRELRWHHLIFTSVLTVSVFVVSLMFSVPRVTYLLLVAMGILTCSIFWSTQECWTKISPVCRIPVKIVFFLLGSSVMLLVSTSIRDLIEMGGLICFALCLLQAILLDVHVEEETNFANESDALIQQNFQSIGNP